MMKLGIVRANPRRWFRISSWADCFSCSTRFISTCSINFSGIFSTSFLSVCSNFSLWIRLFSSKRLSKSSWILSFCSLSFASLSCSFNSSLIWASEILRSISFFRISFSNIAVICFLMWSASRVLRSSYPTFNSSTITEETVLLKSLTSCFWVLSSSLVTSSTTDWPSP